MRDNFFKKLIANVEQNKQLILDAEQFIWKHPELGYKEWETTRYLVEGFERLGYSVQRPEGITGFIADLDTGRPGPRVAIVAELDSLICGEHPDADPKTHAVHACGHHIQSAYLLGCAAAFAADGALDGLSGSIRFISVPAEETIDLEFRNRMIEEGVIRYPAGKVEFLYRGLFDGVDIALMDHAVPDEGDYLFDVFEGANGCIAKHFEYEGVASHAGCSPEDGVNALYAAVLGIQASNSLREKFVEKDYVRFHPIITEAGYAANAIPEVARLDAYVRASSFPVMKRVNDEINRALSAGAAAMGANLLIKDNPGNMPLRNEKTLVEICTQVSDQIFGKGRVIHTAQSAGSTDMGDICTLMPAIQPQSTGACGKLHGKDFRITDPERACVNAAKLMVGMTCRLLENDAALGKACKAGYKPVFASKEAYFAEIDSIRQNRRAVSYNEDGTITLSYRA